MLEMNITLALGGGGVKGFAHVGVLRVLEAEGFRIRGIAGTSAGGMIGALYASGYSPDEIEKRLLKVDQGSLFTRMHGDGPALLGFSGVSTFLTELLCEKTFADLRLPLVITATDLTHGLPVVINQGRLKDAVLATSALPGIFPPVSMDGQLLVDGAVSNPIPVALARALYPKVPVAAVILSPPIGWQQQLGFGEERRVLPFPTNFPLVYKLAARLRLAQAFNIFLQSTDLTGLVLLDKQLRLEHPDVTIHPEVWRYGSLDHVDISQIVKLGESAARKVIPDFRKKITWQYRLRQKAARLISPH
jgi:NTE family protein